MDSPVEQELFGSPVELTSLDSPVELELVDSPVELGLVCLDVSSSVEDVEKAFHRVVHADF